MNYLPRKLNRGKFSNLAKKTFLAVASLGIIANAGCSMLLEETKPLWKVTVPEIIETSTMKDIRKEEERQWKERNNSLAGTSILSGIVDRYIQPDGTIVFTIDANRVDGPFIDWDKIDAFVNMNEYYRKGKNLGDGIAVIKYIPLRYKQD